MLESLTLQDLATKSLGLVRVSVTSVNLRAVFATPRHEGSAPLHFRDHLVTVTHVLRQPGRLIPNSTALIRTVRADSEARFSQGEDALVFLASPEMQGFEINIRDRRPEWETAPVFRVFGGFQGKFTVEHGELVSILVQPGLPPVPFDALSTTLEPEPEPARLV